MGKPPAEPAPGEIDLHVGKRIRLRRALLGLTQEELGQMLNVTYQQIQKYETGRNRISASRLFDTAYALKTTVSYFFEDREPEEPSASLPVKGPGGLTGWPTPESALQAREIKDLVKAFDRITDPSVRQHMVELVKAMARGK